MLNRAAVKLSLQEFWVIVGDPMGMADRRVDRDMTLRGDLGLDSLDMVQLLLVLEDIGRAVSDNDIAALGTVGDLYDYCVTHTADVASWR